MYLNCRRELKHVKSVAVINATYAEKLAEKVL